MQHEKVIVILSQSLDFSNTKINAAENLIERILLTMMSTLLACLYSFDYFEKRIGLMAPCQT